MDNFEPLKFDKMEEDNQLAREYLKKNNSEFRPPEFLPDHHDITKVFDNSSNTIYTCSNDKCDKYMQTSPVAGTFSSKQLRELANKIEEHAELFSQLESLIRKVPKDEVRNCDIKLIVQNLLYSSIQNELSRSQHYKLNYVAMYENTPLAILGFIAQLTVMGEVVWIKAAPNAAVVSYLFTELCHHVGLDLVKVIFVENPTCYPTSYDRIYLNDLQPGCTGVICARCDADSAVDTFLASTTRYPWKLRRLLVQEGVYESVKKVFQWKCNLKSPDRVVDARLKTACSDVYSYEDKLFLVDYSGDPADIQETLGVVTVEAYRTSKELLSLIAQKKPFCLSLWASDVAEANEITYGAESTLVWVNDYGAFDGPPKASRALYSLIEMRYSLYRNVPLCSSLEKLLKLRQLWLKVDANRRAELVLNVLEGYRAELEKDSDKDSLDFVIKLQDSLSDGRWWIDNFAHVDNGQMCVGVDNPLITLLSDDYDAKYSDVVRSLIVGVAILVDTTCDHRALFEGLAAKGMPVVFRPPAGDKREVKQWTVSVGRPMFLTKVVRQNFGTIFAN